MGEVRIVRKSFFHPNRVEKGVSSCRFREIFPYLCSAGQSAAAETKPVAGWYATASVGSSGDLPPDMKIVVGNEDRNLSRRRYRRIVGRSLHPEDDRNAGNQSGVGDHFFAHEHPHLSGQDRRAAEDRTVAARRHVGPFGKGSAAVGVRRRERTADSRFAGRSAALCQDVGSGAVRRDRVRKSGPFLLLVSGLLGCGREYPAGRPFARAGRRMDGGLSLMPNGWRPSVRISPCRRESCPCASFRSVIRLPSENRNGSSTPDGFITTGGRASCCRDRRRNPMQNLLRRAERARCVFLQNRILIRTFALPFGRKEAARMVESVDTPDLKSCGQ